MRKLIFKALRFLPIVIAVAAINYYVDPSQLFGNGRLERWMATTMLRGENVANILNYDDRLLQKYYLEDMPTSKDVFVLGSSRSLLVRSADFPAQSFYNSSLASASVEDYVAVTQLLEERDFIPSTMIVEVTPWIFNKNNGQILWKSLGGEYLRGLTRLNLAVAFSTRLKTLRIGRYAGLFSLPYLQESIRWALIRSAIHATTETNTGETIKLSDGSEIYDAQSQQLSPAEVRKKAIDAVAVPYSLTGFEGIDPSLRLQFEALITSLQDQGVRVVLLLMPYHPDYYNSLIHKKQYKIISDVEAYLHDFAFKNDLEITGSYDPQAAGCSADEYYDGLHARESCLLRILALISWGNR